MLKMYIHAGSGNHGCEAILRSSVKMFQEPMALYSSDPADDRKYGIDKILDLRADTPLVYSKTSLKYLAAAVNHKLTHTDYLFNVYKHHTLFEELKKGDICLSIGGDNYCYAGTDILADVNKELHKKGVKTVLWGCSIEPTVLENPYLVEDMKRYDLITVRETLSMEGLAKAGITDNVVLCSDPAFQLDRQEMPLPDGFTPENTIGVNVSPLAAGHGNLVKENYVSLVNYILTQTDNKVLLIPHVVWASTDDRSILIELYQAFKNTGRIQMVDDHNCMELKGIISQCRMFVGARTHATIAAYSTCVPTLVAGYSIKARGIATDLFGTDEHYVIPVQAFASENSLTESFKWLEANEENIRAYLKKTIPRYIQRSYIAVDAVRKLMK